MFLYYANEKSNDVAGVSSKTVCTQSGIYLEIHELKQCSLNLAPEMYITKERK